MPASSRNTAPHRPVKHLQLDSAFFVALELTHKSLRAVLKHEGGLNCTQYRMLLKVYEYARAEHVFMSMSALGERLGIKPNVATQAAGTLVKAGFVRRIADDVDSRMKSIHITPQGEACIRRVNEALNEQLEADFNPHHEAHYENILVEATIAGSEIDEPFHSEFSRGHIASVTLMNFDMILQKLGDLLRSRTGLSYNGGRIMQRLYEVGKPTRIADLGRQLEMMPNTTTRTVQNLADKGYVRKLASTRDAKAVYLDVSEAGTAVRSRILACFDEVADTYFWSTLNTKQQEALSLVGQRFLANMKEQDRAAERDSLQVMA